MSRLGGDEGMEVSRGGEDSTAMKEVEAGVVDCVCVLFPVSHTTAICGLCVRSLYGYMRAEPL